MHSGKQDCRRNYCEVIGQIAPEPVQQGTAKEQLLKERNQQAATRYGNGPGRKWLRPRGDSHLWQR